MIMEELEHEAWREPPGTSLLEQLCLDLGLRHDHLGELPHGAPPPGRHASLLAGRGCPHVFLEHAAILARKRHRSVGSDHTLRRSGLARRKGSLVRDSWLRKATPRRPWTWAELKRQFRALHVPADICETLQQWDASPSDLEPLLRLVRDI